MQEIREYAPILIPTLNRYEHFKRCVESLAKCTHAEKTELVIGLDYPPSERYQKGWEQISIFVDKIKGFKKVTIFRADKNLGESKNLQIIRTYAEKKYNTYIITEDDNEFSPCFLDYTNKALTLYWDDERVTSISGYNFPIEMGNYNKNIYAHHQYSAWGVGKWVKKFKPIPTNFAIDILKSPNNIRKILRAEPKILFNLLSMIAQQQRWGDALTVASNIVNDYYSIFPSISLCKNHGHDGSGLHCGGKKDDTNELYRNQKFSTETEFTLDEIEIKEPYIPDLKKYLSISLKEIFFNIKLYLKYLIKKKLS